MANHFNDMSTDAVLARLTEQVRMLTETVEKTNECLRDVGKRLEELERWKSWLLGLAAAVSVVVSFVVHLVSKRDI